MFERIGKVLGFSRRDVRYWGSGATAYPKLLQKSQAVKRLPRKFFQRPKNPGGFVTKLLPEFPFPRRVGWYSGVICLLRKGSGMIDVEAIENEIRDIYLWWAERAPGVTPLEVGRLGDLWREFDAAVGTESDVDD